MKANYLFSYVKRKLDGECKQIKKRGGIAPLRPLTLASVKTWGIQQELVVPPATNVSQYSPITKIEIIFAMFNE
ncbi:hypothetical protein [Pararhodonellum marinum]|uniref:hypothetical protein n=1 Tax=Pararhodonellum marinum TaxID=2755358 RepID=UPI00188DD6DF|nr:hypothetical protein [Pararhodonellum marinum]